MMLRKPKNSAIQNCPVVLSTGPKWNVNTEAKDTLLKIEIKEIRQSLQGDMV